MTIADTSTIEVIPRNAFVGADITGVDLTRPLDDATVAAIRRAVLTWKAVFFSEQHLDHAQHVAFARRFGTPSATTAVQPRRWRQIEGYPEIFPIVYKASGSAYPSGRPARPDDVLLSEQIRQETFWHQDGTTLLNPQASAVLRAATAYRLGGDTGFANMAAAYQGLPESLRTFVDGLRAVHRLGIRDIPSEDIRKDIRAHPRSVIHPVVRVHPETGERALFVNRISTEDIIGLTMRQSQRILDLLFDETEKPEYAVYFHWKPGDVAFWDNRSSLHRGPADLGKLGHTAETDRLLYHVALLGDVPVGVDGRPSTALEGEPAEPYVPASTGD
ncbi:TauD/TfdA dioxygenase family protein [Pseudofrankia inefficax]|uniref:Taurine dioxygenase n=1 Tax=Pseudofrankia inefficax (strain DSM 45817 / CECT 9037 / DDB 130130 / EuI1c) TaxID=298654 RepID=E3J3R1_PSEI1|nr:TauD/TfdA family dioxygenase [Pseudofrankia inefficax]ADP79398.1 Taurine dioxygenase [Pseudofrankia inefficax]